MKKTLKIFSLFYLCIITCFLGIKVNAAEDTEAYLKTMYFNCPETDVYVKKGATVSQEKLSGKSYKGFDVDDYQNRKVYTIVNDSQFLNSVSFVPYEVSQGATVKVKYIKLNDTEIKESDIGNNGDISLKVVGKDLVPWAQVVVTSEDTSVSNTYYLMFVWGKWGTHDFVYQFLREEIMPEPDKVTIEDKDLLQAMKDAYDELSAEEQNKIQEDTATGYGLDRLDADLAKIAELEQAEADKAAAEEFANQIAELKGDGSDTDEAIAAAKAAYDALSDGAKEQVKNDYAKLAAAEQAVEDKKATENTSKPIIDTPKNTSVIVKKGTSFKVGKNYYKVTKVTKKTGTVTFTKCASKKLTSITIPATVKYEGYTFKVTQIAKNACKNYKKVKNVTIGKNVTAIGASAFAGDVKLKKLTVKSKVLKKVGAKSLKGINKKAVIKVPKKQLKKYTKLFKGKGQKKTVKVKK